MPYIARLDGVGKGYTPPRRRRQSRRRQDKNKKHNIEIIVDRLIIRTDIQQRLTDSVETASALSGGLVIINLLREEQDLTFYSVVMHADEVMINGAERSGHYLDTIELLTWARPFHKEGVAAGEQVATAATKGSRKDNISLVAESEALMLTQDTLQRTVSLNEIGKEVKAGDMLGTLTLTDDFGNIRVINTPIAEILISGVCVGSAMAGSTTGT